MAYNFTKASSQYFSTTSTPVTGLPCTLACWFTTESTGVNNTLISLQDSNSSSRILLSNNGNVNPKVASQAVMFDASDSFGYIGVNFSPYVVNAWYHAAGVFTSATDIGAFFNGSNGSLVTRPPIVASGIDQILIGAAASPSLDRYHGGKLAEVGIWNAALTADEIASLAKGITCDKIRPQSLVFYAPLVRELIDTKGGLTITNNGATVTEHPRIYG